MSVDYTVRMKDRSKGFELDIEKFIGGYGFGVFHNDRLEEDYPEGDDELVIYDKNKIGRGISVELIEDGFELHMPMPAIREDIDLLFELIQRLAAQIGNCLINDEDSETEIAPEEFPAVKDAMEQENREIAASLLKSIDIPDNGCITLYCAKYPLEFNREMCEEVTSAPDPLKALGDIMHRCQSTPARMIAPIRFYDAPKGLTGVYAVEGGRQIIPLKPSVPFGYCNEDGSPVNVERWYVARLFGENDLRAAEYDSFVAASREHSEFFDGGCILADELPEEKINEIFTVDKETIFGK